MKRSLSVALTGAMVLASTAAVSADPILLIQDRRFTIANARIFNGDFNAPPTRQDIARAGDTLASATSLSDGTNSGVSTATLTSSFADSMHWFGSGMAEVSWNGLADHSAGSLFLVDFTVMAPLTYAFRGALTSSSSGLCCGEASSIARLEFVTGLVDRDGEPITRQLFGALTDHVFGNNSSAVDVNRFGLLTPGEYSLFVFASSNGFSSFQASENVRTANFEFSFDLTAADPEPVPEPASLLLLGTGLAGIFGYRRRVKSGQAPGC